VYRVLSGDTHGTNIIYGKLEPRGDGKAEIKPLKRMTGAHSSALIGAMFVIWGTAEFLGYLAPNRLDEYRQWIGRGIMKALGKIDHSGVLRKEPHPNELPRQSSDSSGARDEDQDPSISVES
jgi:hypothetical protein